MIKEDTMRDLCSIMGFTIALKVASMETIQLSTKIKTKDMYPWVFGARLIKKFNKAYYITIEECEEILKITETCQQYEQRQDMDGLGGCVMMNLSDTLKLEGIKVN